VSPKGDLIAFIEHPVARDSRGMVRVVDRSGEARTLSHLYEHLEGMAWGPDGSEVLFTAFSAGESQSLRAVDLQGNERRVLNAPVNMALHDVGPDGTLLMARQFELQEIIAAVPPGDYERNVTTLGRSQLRQVSSDGSKFVVIFYGEGAGSSYSTYLSYSNGDPSVRLGEGYGHALSPDGRWVFASSYDPPELVLLPTGPEPARRLAITNLTLLEKDNLGNDHTRAVSSLELVAGSWLPDSRRLVVSGHESTNGSQYFLLDSEKGQLTEVTRAGQGVKSPTYFGVPISPDGKYVVGMVNKEFRVYPLEGGASWKLPGLEDCQIAGWSADGNHLYIHVRSKQQVSPTVQVKRYNLARKELEPEDLRIIHPADLSGSLGEPAVAVTDDGRGYVYFSWRVLTDLFLVKNLFAVP
jgi:Tol biopolymer transport system component